MKALRLHAALDARIEDVPDPEPGPGQVKIRVAAASFCGSDLNVYQYFPQPHEYSHPLFGDTGPRVFGHEFAGYVEQLGAGVDGLELGALAAIRPTVFDGTCPACLRGEPNLCENFGLLGMSGGVGGLSEFAIVNRDQVHVVPDHVGPDNAALIESTALAWHSVRRSGAAPSSTVLIIGAWPLGLSLLLCLKAIGVRTVLVAEADEARGTLARSLGAIVIDPDDLSGAVGEQTGPLGVDLIFDAAGTGEGTFNSAVDVLRKGGTSVVVAYYHGPLATDPKNLLLGEKQVVGSFAYTDDDFAAVVDAVTSGRIDPSPLISSRIRLADAVLDGLDHLLGVGRDSELKVIVHPAD